MNNKYLDSNGLLYLWSKIKGLTDKKVDKIEGKTLTSNDFTDEDKIKLDGLKNYELPSATAETLGGIKVGEGLAISSGVLSVVDGSSIDWSKIQNKPELVLKSDIASVYHYKGSVASYTNLPLEGNEIGDVWNVEISEMNYAWTGSEWDPLGGMIEIEGISNEEIDAIIAGE